MAGQQSRFRSAQAQKKIKRKKRKKEKEDLSPIEPEPELDGSRKPILGSENWCRVMRSPIFAHALWNVYGRTLNGNHRTKTLLNLQIINSN
uniref:Uncharacterized protein n=1 Tax=Ditylenchus dipsaci TaxID=166011 RepID=A0A915ENA3_9BILA